MPATKTKIANLASEISSFTATFTARGLTLAGESRSDGSFAMNVTRTAGGALVAVGEGLTAKEATNDAAGRVGIPGSPVFP